MTIGNRVLQQFLRVYLLRRQRGRIRLILTAGVMVAAFAALVVCGIGTDASRSLGGVWTRVCLNEMMGLPDCSDDLHPNPLSG